jgi:hypothetical protein
MNVYLCDLIYVRIYACLCAFTYIHTYVINSACICACLHLLICAYMCFMPVSNLMMPFRGEFESTGKEAVIFQGPVLGNLQKV